MRTIHVNSSEVLFLHTMRMVGYYHYVFGIAVAVDNFHESSQRELQED